MKKKNLGLLASLLSSLISQLVLLLFLLFPSNPSLYNALSPLLLSSSEFAATLIPFSRKRKRVRFSEPGPARTRIRHNPDTFTQFFNLNSSTFDWLCGLLEPLLECRDPVDSPLHLPADARLGIGLFRLATGAHYADVARQFSVSEHVAKFCVKHLCRVLCTNYRFWVGFPSPGDLQSVSTLFESIAGVPNCCGVLCCVRFEVNKEGESVSAQLLVDSSSRILSIIAGFRGDKGDSQVLKSSTLFQDVEKRTILDSQPLEINGVAVPQFFLGHGDYPLLPWLILPYDDPVPGSNEENFNSVFNLMCSPALKAIASLRNWGVLSEPIEGEVKAAVASIGACSILHNMLLSREDYSAFCEDPSDDYSFHNRSSLKPDDSVASAIRDALATKVKEFQSQKL